MITVSKLTKKYEILKQPGDIIKLFSKKTLPIVTALEDISFNIAGGEVVGVIGDNGAGKSTLLKVLTGVTSPTSGSVQVRGCFSAILEVSTGFNQMLTGRENIRQRLMLQGCSQKYVREIEPKIIQFSELTDVIDNPVQTYSTGMAARLIFAIVTESVNDILFIDELLVVGDEHFQGKCFKRIKEICSSGKTIVIASHNISFVERLCGRVIWLEQGRIHLDGPAHQVGMAYYGKNKEISEKNYPKKYGRIVALELEINESRMTVTILTNVLKKTKEMYVQLAVHDNRLGILSCLFNSVWQEYFFSDILGEHKITVSFDLPEGLQEGLIGAVLMRGTGSVGTDKIEDAWGWDNGKQIYFSHSVVKDGCGYIDRKLSWNNAY